MRGVDLRILNLYVTRVSSNERIGGALRALADPIRRAALLRLAQGPATSGQLAALFSVSRPAVSRHLRILKTSQLVTITVHGRHVWYEAQPGPLTRLEFVESLVDQHGSSLQQREGLLVVGRSAQVGMLDGHHFGGDLDHDRHTVQTVFQN